MDWRHSSACRDEDPELFFPEGPEEERLSIGVVRPVCNACKFQEPCLEYALTAPEVFGIWGGLTERERRQVRRRSRIYS